jgi:predicted transcriptional regulator
MAREKNSLPERKYQQRLDVLAEVQRRNRAAETTAAKPATALDHSLGLEAGFKSYQARDIAQMRAIKRRDNAPRQVARWRDGFGAKARRLSDKFVAEQALAESYCATQSLTYAGIDDPVGEAREAAPPLAPVGDAADVAPAVPSSEETAADIASAVPSSEEAAADIAPVVPPSEETAVDIAPAVPTSDETAEAAPPRAPADDEPINWVGWLTGKEKYFWFALEKGAHKDFKQPSASKKWLVQNLVVDRKVIRPDQVCQELAQYLPAIAEATPTVAASAEAPK